MSKLIKKLLRIQSPSERILTVGKKEKKYMNYCSHCKHLYSLTCSSCSNYQGVHDMYEQKAPTIRFYLDGCDICFVAEAPADMTLEQLLKQADRIQTHYCACGVRSLYNKGEEKLPTEIKFDYDDVIKIDPDAPCDIEEKGE